MGDLQQFLAQSTPWGLTVAQTGGIGVVAVILLVGWFIVQIGLRLSHLIFRLGCAAIMIFLCGVISFFAIYNFSSR